MTWVLFFIQYDNLYLSIVIFCSLTFNVIMDLFVFKYPTFSFVQLFCVPFFFFPCLYPDWFCLLKFHLPFLLAG